MAEFQLGSVVWAKLDQSDLLDGAHLAYIGQHRIVDGVHEYYVRFYGQDKRQDRWVRSNELREASPEEAAAIAHNKRSADPDAEQLPHAGSGSGPSQFRVTDAKNIHTLYYGNNCVLQPWYFSPYPDEYGAQETLYICPHCLTYLRSISELDVHMRQCTVLYPPGDEIWRDEPPGGGECLSFWEIDGRLQKTYCQNLCLLSRLFLEHKTLHYDVEAFLFYCLTRRTPSGHELLGYFSKEKQNSNTLACILTLPQYQKRGYSRLLMDMSYALCRVERRRGGPEEPLSDLGTVSFRNYWTEEVMLFLYRAAQEQRQQITIENIVETTGISSQHVIQTLRENSLLYFSQALNKTVICCWEPSVVDRLTRLARKAESRRRVHADQICWRPLPSMIVPESESHRMERLMPRRHSVSTRNI